MLRIILVLAASGLFGCANFGPRSSLAQGEGHYEYVESHPTTKDSAFAKTMEWIALNYNSANSVVQLQDKESGKIVVKGAVSFVNVIDKEYCGYTLAVAIKDQKMKLTFDLGTILPRPGVYAGYPPASEMPKIEAEFKGIKNSVVANIADSRRDDF